MYAYANVHRPRLQAQRGGTKRPSVPAHTGKVLDCGTHGHLGRTLDSRMPPLMQRMH